MIPEMRSEERCEHTFEPVQDLGDGKSVLECKKCHTKGFTNQQVFIEDDEIEFT